MTSCIALLFYVTARIFGDGGSLRMIPALLGWRLAPLEMNVRTWTTLPAFILLVSLLLLLLFLLVLHSLTA